MTKTIEIKVPVLPESVADATIAEWHKKPGDTVSQDENLLDLETDKVMLEIPVPESGVLQKIIQKEGATVTANQPIAVLEVGAKATTAQASTTDVTGQATAVEQPSDSAHETVLASPAVRRLLAEHDLDLNQISGTGKQGRVLKEDVVSYMTNQQQQTPTVAGVAELSIAELGKRVEKRVPMSRLRARIAERLLMVKQQTAMLTTFNEINMQPVMDLRKRYKESFEKQHDIRLGFMSFFVKAVVEALKRFPLVNASIDGQDVVYHGYYDIGMAVSTERGLVVPILRDADAMSMAGVEKIIREYALKARNNKLTMEEMTGGTFTITNGGVFGSMMSTPILNPPQSAILGLHNIVKRPVVENDQIVIRPMMYAALSYDHRIIDGKDSVKFLVTIREMLEDPMRLLLDV